MRPLFLDPGQLTARLELQAPVPAPDGQGGAVMAYGTVAGLWAMIEPIAQQLREDAGAEVFSISHRIWMRHRDDVRAGMRLRGDSRIFVIRAVLDPDETRRYLVCRCEEEGR